VCVCVCVWTGEEAVGCVNLWVGGWVSVCVCIRVRVRDEGEETRRDVNGSPAQRRVSGDGLRAEQSSHRQSAPPSQLDCNWFEVAWRTTHKHCVFPRTPKVDFAVALTAGCAVVRV
jgi:hypothetical protein